jgi:enoyl-CoA hydratase/carnithine racemase
MSYQEILYAVENHIATIPLNRPETLDAFTAVMLQEWTTGVA